MDKLDTAAAILTDCEQRGISLYLQGDKLHASPACELDAGTVRQLAKYAPELKALLMEIQNGPKPPRNETYAPTAAQIHRYINHSAEGWTGKALAAFEERRTK